MFVTGRHELEEQICRVLIKWDVANFIDDEKAATTQPGQLGGEFSPRVCFP